MPGWKTRVAVSLIHDRPFSPKRFVCEPGAYSFALEDYSISSVSFPLRRESNVDCFFTNFRITLLLRFQFGSCLVRIPFRCMFAYLSAHQSSSSCREPTSQTGSLFRARNGMCFFYQFYLGNEEHIFFCLGEYSDLFVFFVGNTAAPVRIPGFPAALIYIYEYPWMSMDHS